MVFILVMIFGTVSAGGAHVDHVGEFRNEQQCEIAAIKIEAMLGTSKDRGGVTHLCLPQ